MIRIDNSQPSPVSFAYSVYKKEDRKNLENRLYKLYTENKTQLNLLTLEELTLLSIYEYEVKDYLIDKVKEQQYEASDEALAFMAREGDKYAKDILAERYVGFVGKVIKQLQTRGIYNKGYDLEDLTQSGYIGFFEGITDYKIEMKNPFKTFARYVIYRHINSLIKKSNNHKMRSLNNSLSYNAPVESDSDTTFEDYLSTGRFEPDSYLDKKYSLYEIWDTLSISEKSVLWYFSQDYSYEEIGEIVFRKTHTEKKKRTKAVDNTMQRINKKRKAFVAA